MSHQDAVATLRSLTKGQRWSVRQALHLLRSLDKRAFARPADYAEAVTAAVIGHRWEAVAGHYGYDTANTLARWLGKAARAYGAIEVLFDAKTQKAGVGYSDKVTERANKATQFHELRESGQGVINGVVFHTPNGVFFQLGMDAASSTPQFGTERRPIVAPNELPPRIDGTGSILPAILLTSKIIWDGSDFANLEPEGIREVNRTLRQIFQTLIAEVGMEKVQKHLDRQTKKAVQQAAQRMLSNETSRGIVAEEVAKNKEAVLQAAQRMLSNETSREIVAEEVAKNKEAVLQAAQRMLSNEASREVVAEEVAKNKEARAAVTQEMSDDELLAELKRRGLVP